MFASSSGAHTQEVRATSPDVETDIPTSRPWGRRDFLRATAATAAAILTGCQRETRRPNLVLVITDDQGWGDLSIAGNTLLQTPNIDRVAEEGMRFDNFHACPVCAPTRASVMTGRYNYRTGVVDTYKGRAMMHSDETTVAELLREAGYRTGIFGKWHLGDNYPLRPMDQGFQESLIHAGGGIGQPADPPDNHYLNPQLMENGTWKSFQGYCTDIFADAALRFMETHRGDPFFIYFATNAPHTPLEVPDEWVAPFRNTGLTENEARVYAMVKNIDDNVGRILAKIAELGLDEETIVLFMTDNGAGGPKRFNAGMRAAKGTVYEGGIRVPLFVRAPRRVAAGSACDRLSAHIDLLPTLCQYAGVSVPRDLKIDGKSLVPLLEGRTGGWADRTIFTQWHRGDAPIPRESAAVLTERYKLVLKRDLPGGRELFDLTNDPGETTDLSAELPHIANDLTRRYDQWFASVSATRGYAPPRIYVGAPEENPVILTRQDWRGPRAGWEEASSVVGHWEVDVRRAGSYRVRLRGQEASAPRIARFRLNGAEASMTIEGGATECTFTNVAISAGAGQAEAWFESTTPEGLMAPTGVWYLDLEWLS
jgi:arylsulfatase A-like enzyme